MCPHCGRDAPIVYRGALPFCTACGKPRAPLSGASFNLAGKPSRVGGTVASVAGGLVLFIGLSFALGLGLLVGALFNTALALAFALPVALVALVIGIVFLRGGLTLRRSGVNKERTTRDQALLALAAHRGAVTSTDAARALGIEVAEADAMLTALAKREPDRVTMDVDDQGVIRYRVTGSPGEEIDRRVRVGENLRVDDDGEESDVEEAGKGAAFRR